MEASKLINQRAVKWLIIVLTAIGVFLVGLFVGKGCSRGAGGVIRERIHTRIDTIVTVAPTPKGERVSGTEIYTLPTHSVYGYSAGGMPRQRIDSDTLSAAGLPAHTVCDEDSTLVELPTVFRYYCNERYEAWVSGPVNPRLDSVRVFSPTTVITREELKPRKRWHLGISAGYGYGTKGFQPYIGIGVTYSILDF